MLKPIRIQNVPEETHETLKTIAKNRGETMSDFLRPKFREIVEKYSLAVTKTEPVAIKKELRICGVSETLADQMAQICKQLGVSPEYILNVELKKIADETPAIMKIKRDY